MMKGKYLPTVRPCAYGGWVGVCGVIIKSSRKEQSMQKQADQNWPRATGTMTQWNTLDN